MVSNFTAVGIPLEQEKGSGSDFVDRYVVLYFPDFDPTPVNRNLIREESQFSYGLRIGGEI